VLTGISKNALVIGLTIGFIASTSCGRTRYPDYYTLNLPAAPSVPRIQRTVAGSVAVREFRSPVFLREGAIVYRPSTDEIAFYQYHRWAEDPRRTVTDLMIQNLEASKFFRSVDLYDGGRESPDFVLSGTLEHLEEVDQNGQVSVQVTISARLVSVHTGQVVWQDTSSKMGTPDQRTIAGIVAEMSRQMGSVVESLIASLGNRVSPVLAAGQ
jgi:cholesterol transport system auxiliary component